MLFFSNAETSMLFIADFLSTVARSSHAKQSREAVARSSRAKQPRENMPQ
jgi:hypothetical protein